MAMTKLEKSVHDYIHDYLIDEGYGEYAKIFNKLDLHLTDAKRVVGFMDPKTGTITINKNVDEAQFSVIIRHEILHNYLKHEFRLLKYLAEQHGLDEDELFDSSLNEIKKDLNTIASGNLNKLRKELYADDTFNIAADYEISNRGYTEEDKKTIRALKLNGEILGGLVTEDKHPEWKNYSVEDMYEELMKEKIEKPKEDNYIHGFLMDDGTFVSLDGNIYRANG